MRKNIDSTSQLCYLQPIIRAVRASRFSRKSLDPNRKQENRSQRSEVRSRIRLFAAIDAEIRRNESSFRLVSHSFQSMIRRFPLVAQSFRRIVELCFGGTSSGQGGAARSASIEERRSHRILLHAWDFCGSERVPYRSRRTSARNLLYVVAEVGHSGKKSASSKSREQRIG